MKNRIVIGLIASALMLSGCNIRPYDNPSSHNPVSSDSTDSSEEISSSSSSSSSSIPEVEYDISININAPETINVKETIDLKCNGYPKNQKITDKRWSSDDKTIANVLPYTGKLTGVKAGTTTIRVNGKNENGETINGSISVQVIAPAPTSVEIDKEEIELSMGSSKTLTATVLPAGADQTVTWTSGNTNVATVNNGVVTAKNTAGTAVITAKTSNGLTDTCTVNVVEQALDKYTLLIYICGSNLESDSDGGLASMDIEEIRSVPNQPKDLNIAFQTGGSKSWHSGIIGGNGINKIDSSKSKGMGRYHIENNNVIKDGNVSSASMGLTSTLQSFLEWGISTYPAQKYSLILWNHGGALTGCCFDENYSDDSLTADEVDSAVTGAKNKLGITENFEFITYDACLMSVQEIAEINSHNFNYMLSSQEVEGGYGYDYDEWLPTLYSDLDVDTGTLLEKIGHTFIVEEGKLGATDQTQSAFDLTKMSAYKTAFNNFATALKGIVKNSTTWNSFVSLAKNKALQFGYDEDYGYTYDVFDVKGVLDGLKSNSTYSSISFQIQDVLDALEGLVIYNEYQSGYKTKKPCGINVLIPVSGYTTKNEYKNQCNFDVWYNLISQYGSWYSSWY